MTCSACGVVLVETSALSCPQCRRLTHAAELEELAKRVKALIVTKGAEGSVIYASGQQIDIPCVKADTLTDPTGCGDAYRAGLLFGIANGMDWQSTGQLGALIGALKIAHRGGQNHVFTRDEIDQRYFENFGSRIL